MRFPPRLKPGIPTQDQGWSSRSPALQSPSTARRVRASATYRTPSVPAVHTPSRPSMGDPRPGVLLEQVIHCAVIPPPQWRGMSAGPGMPGPAVKAVAPGGSLEVPLLVGVVLLTDCPE